MARCIAVGFLESSKSRIQCTHCISRVRTSFASHKMLNGDWLIPVLSSDPQQPLVGAPVFHYVTLPELKLTQAVGRTTTLLTMSSSPVLPIELYERVIDHLSQDRNALITCMLVCRAWCPRSRFHLNTSVTLASSQHTRRFSQLLKREAWLRTGVTSISISPSPTTRRLPMSHLTAVSSMLGGKIPSLQSIFIWYAEWQPRTIHRNTFCHLSTFTRLDRLCLHCVTFPSKLTLARLIGALPNLAQLWCTSLIFQSTKFNQDAVCSLTTQLKGVRLDGLSDDVAHLIAEQLGIVGGVVDFQCGHSDFTSYSEAPSAGAMMSLLQHSGPALRYTSLRFWGPPRIAQVSNVAEPTGTST